MVERIWRKDSDGPSARVLIVGGDDVDKRIDLMHALKHEFRFAAAGSDLRRAEKFVAAGFPFFYYPMDRGSNPFSDLRSFLFLSKVIRRLQPDLVHAFATKPSVWGRLAARRAGVPVVIGTIPGLGSLYSSNDLTTRLVRMLYEPLQRRACYGSELTIFQNEGDLNQFVGSGVAPAQRSTIIPGSGVRTDEFDQQRASPTGVRRFREAVGAKEGDVVITMMSRIIRSKGVLDFAGAARDMLKAHDNVRFALVGPDDRNSLDRLSSKELDEVKESVTWLGERSDVREIFAGSEVFVLPSLYREGVPRAMLEAASMGLPLVTTRSPGCESVVDEERNGFLIEAGDVEELKKKLEILITDPLLRKRFAGESREIAVKRFDLSVVVRATSEHYKRLLEGAGRPAVPASPPGATEGSPRKNLDTGTMGPTSTSG